MPTRLESVRASKRAHSSIVTEPYTHACMRACELGGGEFCNSRDRCRARLVASLLGQFVARATWLMRKRERERAALVSRYEASERVTALSLRGIFERALGRQERPCVHVCMCTYIHIGTEYRGAIASPLLLLLLLYYSPRAEGAIYPGCLCSSLSTYLRLIPLLPRRFCCGRR